MAVALFRFRFVILTLTLFHPHFRTRVLALATQNENDFSYMKAVTNATDLPPWTAEYDYIVIGGGTAGCPLAATLSANYSVLVLERGGDPETYQDFFRAENFEAHMVEEDDGEGPVERFRSEDGVENARGRVLGGGSMINMGFYSRAEKEFYEKSGVEWEMGLVEKAYEWVEESIVHGSELLEWQNSMKEALLEAGVGPYNGFSLDHKLGTKYSGSIFDEFGGRHGAAELLNKGDLSKLRVAVRATVERILFSGLTAVGVIFRDSKGKSHRAFVRTKGEIILSAGTIGSPQLLLLSGVGPASELSFLKIPVVQPQPHVGKFMADNPRNNINLLMPFTLFPSYLQIVGITPDFYLETASFIVPFTTSFATKPSSLSGNYLTSSSIDLSAATICTKVPGPSSYGTLSLSSAVDVEALPNVRFNYFSDPTDLARCVKAMRKVGDLLKTKALAAFKFDKNFDDELGFKFYGPSLPMDYTSSNNNNDSSLEELCRSTVTTWWHYHGGCRVGKVVDGDFRVIGIEGLRVVDGSVLSISPGTNPQATIMMLGRYVGLRILQERMN
ncbi:(R)-mandelonitrile lyase 1-like [Humulus lupulus]|uniref:(R)-mandelonitrile lyase 1-like n=1 Tax=Humulus lupulus TaxID=3486 RepID=UPI002B4101C3|nr:(R)-mandelonitrile lyase 1-like [Humulus lupulus]